MLGLGDRRRRRDSSEGWCDKLLMRLADVILSFPILLLATAILAVTQASVITISVIVGIGFGAYLAGSSTRRP